MLQAARFLSEHYNGRTDGQSLYFIVKKNTETLRIIYDNHHSAHKTTVSGINFPNANMIKNDNVTLENERKK